MAAPAWHRRGSGERELRGVQLVNARSGGHPVGQVYIERALSARASRQMDELIRKPDCRVPRVRP